MAWDKYILYSGCDDVGVGEEQGSITRNFLLPYF